MAAASAVHRLPPFKRARLSHTDYRIAIIVPLGVELAPIRAMLDAVHEDRPSDRPQNAYVLGELGQHNIVIAILPATGNNDSGVVAAQLRNDFPFVQFGLLVGVAGGVPGIDGQNDIRLGDLAVSQPTDTTGGVLQFDKGKRHAADHFQRTGHLDQPPRFLLATIKKLRAQHAQEGYHSIQLLISD